MKPVYHFDDLQSRDLLDHGADQPARLCVIGQPVAHSASPRMHQPALDAIGINARYIRLELNADQFQPAIQRLRELDFIGCNVTVPHKFAALAACDRVDPAAQALGAVNTIRFDSNGSHGFNTDGPGFAAAIEEHFGRPLSSLKVGIAGAGGGAGQAIATQCLLSGSPSLLLINRSQDTLQSLVHRLRNLNSPCHIEALGFDHPSLATRCLDCDLLVNTSSVGLKPNDPSILSSHHLKREHFIYDTIYQPAITPLLDLANQLGCRNANGLSMLIHQGALAFQHWFPKSQPLDIMRAALSLSSPT